MPSLSVAVLIAFLTSDGFDALSSESEWILLSGTENLGARRGSDASHITGPFLDSSTFLGDGRRGCLKLFCAL